MSYRSILFYKNQYIPNKVFDFILDFVKICSECILVYPVKLIAVRVQVCLLKSNT